MFIIDREPKELLKFWRIIFENIDIKTAAITAYYS
jgi:hypothetical protein